MLTAERRRSIMQTLQREGKVLASELSRNLHVSEDTIRRDLRELAAAGELTAAEKLGTAAPYIIGPLSDLTHLVTERSVPDEMLAPYRESGITIIRA